jgi:ribosome-binding protein aMBF1 (putative translation factor)
LTLDNETLAHELQETKSRVFELEQREAKLNVEKMSLLSKLQELHVTLQDKNVELQNKNRYTGTDQNLVLGTA